MYNNPQRYKLCVGEFQISSNCIVYTVKMYTIGLGLRANVEMLKMFPTAADVMTVYRDVADVYHAVAITLRVTAGFPPEYNLR